METNNQTQSRAEESKDRFAAEPNAASNGEHGVKALHHVTALIGELKEYAAYYLSAKIDSIKLTVRNLGVYAVLGIVGLIAFSTLVSTAVVLLLVGLSLGLGHLMGDRLWLGGVIVGVLVLAGIGVGAYIGMSALTKSFKRNTVRKYEQRQNWQRGQFGRDVNQAAAAAERKK